MTSLAIRLTTLLVGFFQAMLTARLLGPDGYGVVALTVALAMLLGTTAVLGFGTLAIREVPRISIRKDHALLRGFLRYSLILTLIVSVVFAAGLGGVTIWTGPASPAFHSALIVAPLLVPLFAFLAWSKGVAQGFGHVVAAQAPLELLRPTIMSSLLALCMIAAWPLGVAGYIWLAIAAAIVASVVAAVLTCRIVRSRVPAGEYLLEPGHWSKAAFPFLLISLLGMLLAEINTLLLGWIAGPKETGLFQPVARLAPLVLIGMQAVAMRYSPRVSELWATGDRVRLVHLTDRVTVVSTLVAGTVALGMLAVAPVLLGLFGREFVSSTPALLWAVAAQVFNAACGPVGIILSMSQKTRLVLVAQVAGLITNIALGIWLIPQSGAVGAAQAFAGGIVVWNLLMVASVRRELGFDPSLAACALRMLAPKHKNSE